MTSLRASYFLLLLLQQVFLQQLLLQQVVHAEEHLQKDGIYNYDSLRTQKHCYLLEGSSIRIKMAHVDKALTASSLHECERECDLAAFFHCKSFAYSGTYENQFEDNCLLSSDDSYVLDLLGLRDFVRDPEFGYYQRAVGDFCRTPTKPVVVQLREHEDALGSGCYRLVRARTRIARLFIQSMVHSQDRAECEHQCAKAKNFTCRGFNFRNNRQFLRLPNCELSLQDTYGADLDEERTFHVDENFDFYERTKIGRTCEGIPLPPNHLDDPPATTTRTGLTDWGLRDGWPRTPSDVVSPSSLPRDNNIPSNNVVGNRGTNTGTKDRPVNNVLSNRTPNTRPQGSATLGNSNDFGNNRRPTTRSPSTVPQSINRNTNNWQTTKDRTSSSNGRNNLANKNYRGNSGSSHKIGSANPDNSRAGFGSDVAGNKGAAIHTTSIITSSGRVDIRVSDVTPRKPRPFMSEPVMHGGTSSSLTDITGDFATTGRPLLPRITAVDTTATFNTNHRNTGPGVTLAGGHGVGNHIITSNTASISSNTAIIIPSTASATFTTKSNIIITRQPVVNRRIGSGNRSWPNANNIAPIGNIRQQIKFHRISQRDRDRLNNNKNNRFHNRNNNNVRNRNRNTNTLFSSNRPGNRNVNRQTVRQSVRNNQNLPNQHFIITSSERTPSVKDNTQANANHLFSSNSLPPPRDNSNRDNFHSLIFHRVPGRTENRVTAGNRGVVGFNQVIDTSVAAVGRPGTSRGSAAGIANRHYWISREVNDAHLDKKYMWISPSDLINAPVVDTLNYAGEDNNGDRYNSQNNRNQNVAGNTNRNQISSNVFSNKVNSNRRRPSSSNNANDNVRQTTDRFKPISSGVVGVTNRYNNQDINRPQNNRFVPDPSSNIFNNDRVNLNNFTLNDFYSLFGYGQPLNNLTRTNSQNTNQVQQTNNRFNSNNIFDINFNRGASLNDVNLNNYGSGGVYGTMSNNFNRVNSNTNDFKRVKPFSPSTIRNNLKDDSINNNGADSLETNINNRNRHTILPVNVNFPNIMYDFPGGRRNQSGFVNQNNVILSSTISSLSGANVNFGRPVYTTPRPFGGQFIPPGTNIIHHSTLTITAGSSNAGSQYRPISRPPWHFHTNCSTHNVNSNHLGAGGNFWPGTASGSGFGSHSRPVSSSGTNSRPGFGTASRPGSGINSRPWAGTGSASGGGSRPRPGTGSRPRPGVGSSSGFVSAGSGLSLSFGGSIAGSNSFSGHLDSAYREDCYPLARANTRMERHLLADSGRVFDVDACRKRCHQATKYFCTAFAFRYRGHDSRGNNCFLSDREFTEVNSFDLLVDSSCDLFQRRVNDRQCSGQQSGSSALHQSHGGTETVSGLDCYEGTLCTEDLRGSYWYCETNAFGAWDYCCRPGQVCSNNEESAFRWCYVGSSSRDQWRPCMGNFDRDFLLESNSSASEVLELSQLLHTAAAISNFEESSDSAPSRSRSEWTDGRFLEEPNESRSSNPINPSTNQLNSNGFKESLSKLYPNDSGPRLTDNIDVKTHSKEKTEEAITGAKANQTKDEAGENRKEPQIEVLDLPNLG